MTGKTISQLPASGPLSGNQNVELSGLSPTVVISASTISANAADNSFNDSASGFIAAGFAPGDRINVRGASNTSNNIFTAVITSCTSGKIIIGGTDGDVIVNEAAGSNITISKWISSRSNLTDLAKWNLAWTLIGQNGAPTLDSATWSHSTNVSSVIVNGLDRWNELLVYANNISVSVSGTRVVRVSVDNGVSFFQSTGDYTSMGDNGTGTTRSAILFHTSSSALARTVVGHITNLKGAQKMAISNSTGIQMFLASQLDINAIQLSDSAGGLLTGGSLFVYAR